MGRLTRLTWGEHRQVFRKHRKQFGVGRTGWQTWQELVGVATWMAEEFQCMWGAAERAVQGAAQATAAQATAQEAAAQEAAAQEATAQEAAEAAATGAATEAVAGCRSEGYCSGDSSDLEGEAEVVVAALREWHRQHGWLHSPEERAADRRALVSAVPAVSTGRSAITAT
jgi:hypothetical protein